jgi:hypothetical protein
MFSTGRLSMIFEKTAKGMVKETEIIQLNSTTISYNANHVLK